jgi:hypothetical protein
MLWQVPVESSTFKSDKVSSRDIRAWKRATEIDVKRRKWTLSDGNRREATLVGVKRRKWFLNYGTALQLDKAYTTGNESEPV